MNKILSRFKIIEVNIKFQSMTFLCCVTYNLVWKINKKHEIYCLLYENFAFCYLKLNTLQIGKDIFWKNMVLHFIHKIGFIEFICDN